MCSSDLNIEDMYLEMGIRREVYDFGSQIEGTLKERFDAIDKVAEYNQLKVVHAMQKCKVNAGCFKYASGYGYDDPGRDTLEEPRPKTVTLRSDSESGRALLRL